MGHPRAEARFLFGCLTRRLSAAVPRRCTRQFSASGLAARLKSCHSRSLRFPSPRIDGGVESHVSQRTRDIALAGLKPGSFREGFTRRLSAALPRCCTRRFLLRVCSATEVVAFPVVALSKSWGVGGGIPRLAKRRETLRLRSGRAMGCPRAEARFLFDALRGAEAPLFHGAAHFLRDGSLRLFGCAASQGRFQETCADACATVEERPFQGRVRFA